MVCWARRGWSGLEGRALPNLYGVLTTCSGPCLGALKVTGISLLISVPPSYHLPYLIGISKAMHPKWCFWLPSLTGVSEMWLALLACDNVKLSSFQWAAYLSSQNPSKLDITQWRNHFAFLGTWTLSSSYIFPHYSESTQPCFWYFIVLLLF